MAPSTTEFIPGRPGERLKIGLVIELDRGPPATLVRITHLFDQTIYTMPVSTPDMARYAIRPYERQLSKVTWRLAKCEWRLGRLKLPQEFLSGPAVDSEDGDPIEGAYTAIAPLIEVFDDERYLARSSFSAHILRRANELEISPVSLRRLLLRYYYFGRIKKGLLPLKPGRPIGRQRPESSVDTVGLSAEQIGPKRRGRQPIEAKKLGPNTFVVTDDDVADMVECLEALASRGRTTKVEAHKEYIKGRFRNRHPEKHKQYIAKQCPLPVTLRQFREITSKYATLSRDASKNVAGHSHRAEKGALLATGPGEVYEIDATGGRIFLVDSNDPNHVLGTPIIYIIIDRWSRFIVSVYVTLRPASWEEIRFALLVAFTPRKRRFKNLGVNVDEDRWPQGRVCARMVQDRGSEMISLAMLGAAVDGLHIEAETLPPLCPDGKGIIERVNRELKRRMAQRKMKGVFAERPVDPKTKRAFKAAKFAAVHSLREVYWALIDIVDTYNNSPHSHLEARSILRRAGVKPTPRDAYLWGLANITGIESPPLDDADYQRLLLGTDKATLANGAMMYRGRKYLPMNAAAERQARLSTSRRRAIAIKLDRSDAVEFFAPNGDEDWPLWRVNAAGLQELQEITLEEEDYLAGNYKLLIAETRNDAFIEDQMKTAPVLRRATGRSGATKSSRAPSTPLRRNAESTGIKRALLGKSIPESPHETPQQSKQTTKTDLSWEEIERRDRLEIIERQRKARK